jgi:hypothetical protein
VSSKSTLDETKPVSPGEPAEVRVSPHTIQRALTHLFPSQIRGGIPIVFVSSSAHLSRRH